MEADNLEQEIKDVLDPRVLPDFENERYWNIDQSDIPSCSVRNISDSLQLALSTPYKAVKDSIVADLLPNLPGLKACFAYRNELIIEYTLGNTTSLISFGKINKDYREHVLHPIKINSTSPG